MTTMRKVIRFGRISKGISNSILYVLNNFCQWVNLISSKLHVCTNYQIHRFEYGCSEEKILYDSILMEFPTVRSFMSWSISDILQTAFTLHLSTMLKFSTWCIGRYRPYTETEFGYWWFRASCMSTCSYRWVNTPTKYCRVQCFRICCVYAL